MKYKVRITGISADLDLSTVQILYHVTTDPKKFVGHEGIVCMNVNDLTDENITKAIEEHETKIMPKVIKEHDLVVKWIDTQLIIEVSEQCPKGEDEIAERPTS